MNHYDKYNNDTKLNSIAMSQTIILWNQWYYYERIIWNSLYVFWTDKHIL